MDFANTIPGFADIPRWLVVIHWPSKRVLRVILGVLAAVMSGRCSTQAEDIWQSSTVSNAATRLQALLDKSVSVRDESGTLRLTLGALRPPAVITMNYFALSPAGLVRIETLQWSQSGSIVQTNTAYTYIIIPDSKCVYVEREGNTAMLDHQSSEQWLRIANLLCCKCAPIYMNDAEIGYLGPETLDDKEADVFSVARPYDKGKLWVERDRGLIVKAELGHDMYQLHELKINTGLQDALFQPDIKDKDLPEISEANLGKWEFSGTTRKALARKVAEPWTVFLAAKSGSLRGVEQMIATNSQLITAVDDLGMTPLHYAAMNGHLELVKWLISKKAEVDKKDTCGGATPLWLAAAHGRTEVVKLLILDGASVNTRALAQFTPLHVAAFHGYKDIVQLLLEKGAEINAAAIGGKTPLHLANEGKNEEIAAYLRQHGAAE